MLHIIDRLIKAGHAYVLGGTVYFSIESYKHYGALSGRKLGDMISGSRVEVVAEKLHPGDFVLWKPATDLDMKLGACWPSPWGVGRPGWHVECSAMSYRYLGESFDIHGGGADLMFPHHENEISQSCCAFPGSEYARYWVHNGFLTVNGGEKMSKSLGNVITVRGLLGNGVDGEVIRVLNKSAMLMGMFRNFPERKLSNIRSLVDEDEINRLIEKRAEAKGRGDFELADEIRKSLSDMGIGISDGKDGATRWHRKN
ncbi:hypothetical protein GH714_042643 [Hevea brasiliensis]|uniref:tRNA synthetases class I catalytic domain-containing protein n=1 Tax=Hevea brasiliensis TaxID=3981 RepID=A0A6A6K349_HEVBR|nr:hypothetical protein GH714_042643 [Hevea brasiliensis]